MAAAMVTVPHDSGHHTVSNPAPATYLTPSKPLACIVITVPWQFGTISLGGELHCNGIHPPKQTWILDSVVGCQVHPSMLNVIEDVSSLTLPVASRKGLATMLREQHSLEEGTTTGMASTLTPIQDGAGFE
ncbi:hypothetical protein ACHAW6_015641 [Cyclotella cf. meneghiniana]